LISWRARGGKFGATRRFTDGKAGRCEIQGNLVNRQPGPEDAGIGATRNLIGGDSEERRAGATRSFLTDTAEGCEIRGNSEIHRRQSREMQNSGQPGDSSQAIPPSEEPGQLGVSSTVPLKDARFEATRKSVSGTAEWTEDSGQLEDSSPARPKDAGYGATRRRVVGLAGSCRVRGNSDPHQ